MNSIKAYFKEALCFLDRIAGVMDHNGEILYSTDEKLAQHVDTNVNAVLRSEKETVQCEGKTYFVIKIAESPYCVVFVDGTDEKAKIYAEMLGKWLKNSGFHSTVVKSRSNFLRSIIAGNEFQSDVFAKSRRFEMHFKQKRRVFALHVDEKRMLDVLLALEYAYSNDTTIQSVMVDACNIAVVKSYTYCDDCETLEEELKLENACLLAKKLCEIANLKAKAQCLCGIGAVCQDLSEIATSYKEAILGIKLSHITEQRDNICIYEKLGLGRLLYHVPRSVLQLYVSEVFPKDSYKALSEELLETMEKFFQCNLNVSEAARKLFVHRNTMHYRLDKIHKLTGIDLKDFDQAVIFRLGQQAKKFVDYDPAAFNDMGENDLELNIKRSAIKYDEEGNIIRDALGRIVQYPAYSDVSVDSRSKDGAD